MRLLILAFQGHPTRLRFLELCFSNFITKILRLLFKKIFCNFPYKDKMPLESSNECTATPCPRTFHRTHQRSWQFRVRRKLSKQPKLEQNAFQNWYKMFNDMYISVSDVKDWWIERLITQIVARKEGSISDECGTNVCYQIHLRYMFYITRTKILTAGSKIGKSRASFEFYYSSLPVHA